MLVKANVSFAGRISMRLNEIREIENEDIVKDLIRAGYVCEVAQNKKEEPAEEVQGEPTAEPVEEKKPAKNKKGDK